MLQPVECNNVETVFLAKFLQNTLSRKHHITEEEMCQENDSTNITVIIRYQKEQNDFKFETNISISFDIARPFLFRSDMILLIITVIVILQ